MCGIIGYVGNGAGRAAETLLAGLGTLEYRGYDSAGIAVLGQDGAPKMFKRAGKLANLRSSMNGAMPEGNLGVGHTRWATHGGPTDDNAHPHTDCAGNVVVVHNGIVENYAELRRELAADGHAFSSQTDSECIPHMIEDRMGAGCGLEDAVASVARRIKGANAIVAFATSERDRIVGVRLGNAGGIVAGQGEDGAILSSDLPALLPHTGEVVYLGAGEMVSLGADGLTFKTLDGAALKKSPTRVARDALSAARGRVPTLHAQGDTRTTRRGHQRAGRARVVR